MDPKYIPKTANIDVVVSKDVESYIISVNNMTSPHYINSVLTTLFDKPPLTSFTLSKENTKNSAFNLTQSEVFNAARDTTCLISYNSPAINLDEKFQQLLEEAESAGLSSNTDLSQLIFGQKIVDLESYSSTIQIQRFLTLAILEVVNHNSHNKFANALVGALTFTQNSFFRNEIVTNSLVDVIDTVFSEQCLWETKTPAEQIPQFDKLVRIIAVGMSKSEAPSTSVINALKEFAPSHLVDSLIKGIIKILITRLNESDIFKVISSVFPDKEIINCFTSRQNLQNFIFDSSNSTFFPYITVYCLVCNAIYDGDSEASIATSVSQIGSQSLFTSNRIVYVVLKPILDYIFDTILLNDVPYLEITKTQLAELQKFLERMLPILKETIGKYRVVQLSALNKIVKYLVQRRFEPKGVCFVLFHFLYDKEVVHASVFNSWMSLINNSPGKHSALLEVNTLLMTLIPGPFPAPSNHTNSRNSEQRRGPAPPEPSNPPPPLSSK